MSKSCLIIPILALVLASCQNSSRSLDSAQIQGENIVNGRPESALPAVVMLENSSVCTGSLVGLNPPTVITARHCADADARSLNGVAPMRVIEEDFPNYKFDIATAQAPGDMAILVYPQSLAAQLQVSEQDVFSVEPVSLDWASPIRVCGFGSVGQSGDDATPVEEKRCGNNFLITENSDFAFPDVRKALDGRPNFDFEALSEQEKVQYIFETTEKDLQNYGPNTRYGIGRLTGDAFRLNPYEGFDQHDHSALINHGDSGGPWFTTSFFDEHPHLFAVTSQTISDESSDHLVISSVAWRLNIPWSQALMAKAVAQGADITGFSVTKGK